MLPNIGICRQICFEQTLPTMKIIFVFVLLITFQSFSQKSRDQRDIENVLAHQTKLWNNGDIPGFMEYYQKAEDLKFISKNGVTNGWSATLNRYLTTYPDSDTMGKLKFDIIEIDVTSGKTAWILGKWNLERTKLENIGGYFTLLLKKINGKWLIVRDHTS